MRLFTGIPLPDEITRNLEKLVESLRPTARIRWTPVRNLHVTTKFIGEWPDERLEELVTALRGLPERGDIPIAVERLGWFPNPSAPKILWAGIEASDELARLARDTDQCLSRLGVPVERRRFSPHLTLARIRPPVRLEELQTAIAALPSVEFGSFTADRFYLYRSQLDASGAQYTRLAELPLVKR